MPPVGLLARRATYGLVSGLEAEIEKAGALKWLDMQLDPDSIDDPNGEKVDAQFRNATLTFAQLGIGNNKAQVSRQIQERAFGRSVWSSRQLHEVIVDFWSNHLNVPADDDKAVIMSRPEYDKVIRAGALGKFRDLLSTSGKSPAMVKYLDLEASRKGSPNENYAREVMELHTVGVGEFSEEDVKQLSLLLTGWYVDDDKKVKFNAENHHEGPVKVMGRTFDNPDAKSGPEMWDQLIDFLVTRPSTATRIAQKLAMRFVSDTPSDALVARLAKVYLDGDTAIAPVVRSLFTSQEFADSAGKKVKRPAELLASHMRVMTAPSGPPQNLDKALRSTLDSLTAHLPLVAATPEGYADVASAWQSPGVALGLFNYACELARGASKFYDATGTDAIVKAGGNTFASVTDAAAEVILQRPANAQEKAGAATLFKASSLSEPLQGEDDLRTAAQLAAVLMLNSADHLLR
ncbi:MAG: DUF1800 domain-containing protein [Dermatophilaceae bacterium]